MADGVNMGMVDVTDACYSFEDALAHLRAGSFSTGFSVQLADRIIAFNSEDVTSGVALQRLSGLDRLMSALREPASKNVQALRSSKPVLHPRVAEILDALRQKD